MLVNLGMRVVKNGDQVLVFLLFHEVKEALYVQRDTRRKPPHFFYGKIMMRATPKKIRERWHWKKGDFSPKKKISVLPTSSSFSSGVKISVGRGGGRGEGRRGGGGGGRVKSLTNGEPLPNLQGQEKGREREQQKYDDFNFPTFFADMGNELQCFFLSPFFFLLFFHSMHSILHTYYTTLNLNLKGFLEWNKCAWELRKTFFYSSIIVFFVIIMQKWRPNWSRVQEKNHFSAKTVFF